ncbi:MAG: aconitase X catalytic domain-containing protein [Candidatus Eremiobacteraeota bacterium]|nr:aconitase X catalytic domain-containing protein [Candidatus Eremiobacteraeota bacterium]
MHLTQHEKKIAAGQLGEPLRIALEQQIGVGEFFGAERFVEISNVHVMGDYEVMGEAGKTYLENLVASGARACVPCTRNAACVDYDHAEQLHQSPALVENEREVRRLIGELGFATVETCINYQSVYTPRFREHVAWGDTGTVAYANGALGARTNYESGPAAIAAAITGRTPAYGFHLDEARRPNYRFVVEAPLRDVADYGAVAAIVGERARGYWNVPLIELRDASPAPDDLKHLGATLASFGSLAMYHVLGVTPEAPDRETVMKGATLLDEVSISAADVDDVYARGTPADPAVNLVVFTAPQLSLVELERLADLFADRKIANGSTVIVTTNSMMFDAAQHCGVTQRIKATGALVLQGVCWYIMDPAAMRKEFGWKRVVTNSGKLFNIIKAHGYEPVLRRTADAVEAAVTGRLP